MEARGFLRQLEVPFYYLILILSIFIVTILVIKLIVSYSNHEIFAMIFYVLSIILLVVIWSYLYKCVIRPHSLREDSLFLNMFSLIFGAVFGGLFISVIKDPLLFYFYSKDYFRLCLLIITTFFSAYSFALFVRIVNDLIFFERH